MLRGIRSLIPIRERSAQHRVQSGFHALAVGGGAHIVDRTKRHCRTKIREIPLMASGPYRADSVSFKSTRTRRIGIGRRHLHFDFSSNNGKVDAVVHRTCAFIPPPRQVHDWPERSQGKSRRRRTSKRARRSFMERSSPASLRSDAKLDGDIDDQQRMGSGVPVVQRQRMYRLRSIVDSAESLA